MHSTHSYTDKEKLEIIRRTLPPEKISLVALAKELGIAKTTLFGWKKKLKETSEISVHSKNKSKWSAQDKIHIVMETYQLNEADLSA